MATRERKQWLVIIDMQEIFAQEGSQWHCPEYRQAEAVLEPIAANFPGRVIWTKFVRDDKEEGSWRGYYERWDQCREAPESHAWDLTLPTRPDDLILTRPTFSKWDAELLNMTSCEDDIVVGGVATDCCVLGTVLGAVDAGRHVTVIRDGCAGASRKVHEEALSLMDMLSPMVSIRQSTELEFR